MRRRVARRSIVRSIKSLFLFVVASLYQLDACSRRIQQFDLLAVLCPFVCIWRLKVDHFVALLRYVLDVAPSFAIDEVGDLLHFLGGDINELAAIIDYSCDASKRLQQS